MNQFMSQMVDLAKLQHILSPMIDELGALYRQAKQHHVYLTEQQGVGIADACNNRIAQVFATLSDKRFEQNINDIKVISEANDEVVVIKPTPKLAKLLNQCGIRNFGYIFTKEQE